MATCPERSAARSALALGLGVLLLIFTGATSFILPLFALATMFSMLHFFAWMSPGSVIVSNIPIHLLTGSTLIFIFFLAADPQISPRSKLGKVYAGVLLGIIEVLFRLFLGMPEAMFISVLLVQAASYFFDLKLAPPDDEGPVGHTLSTSSLGRL